jgi:hypothetical protein
MINNSRPAGLPEGWGKKFGLARDNQDLIAQERREDARKRGGANFTDPHPAQGDAVVKLYDIGDGRFSSTINHSAGTETKEHDSFQSAIEHARQSFLEKQRAKKKDTISSEDAIQSSRGNAEGDPSTYSTR